MKKKVPTELPIGWTSLGQSKMLEKNGLDPDTADMYYMAYISLADGKPIKNPHYCAMPNKYTERTAQGCGFTKVDYIPCWTLGKLMEVLPDGAKLLKESNVTSYYDVCADMDKPAEWRTSPMEAVYEATLRWLKNGDVDKY